MLEYQGLEHLDHFWTDQAGTPMFKWSFLTDAYVGKGCLNLVTQSKSKKIITRSMCVISLIVFTDKYQGHVWTLYTCNGR